MYCRSCKGPALNQVIMEHPGNMRKCRKAENVINEDEPEKSDGEEK